VSLYHNTPSILEQEEQLSLEEVAHSVLHKDIRLENMLWNVENQRVMLIDFERSTAYERKRRIEHILDEVSPNAKQRRLIAAPEEWNGNRFSTPVRTC
jgi:thiamine kinase-like enzyme